MLNLNHNINNLNQLNKIEIPGLFSEKIAWQCLINPRLAEPGLIKKLNTVDQDQLASDEVIWSGSTLSQSTCKHMFNIYDWNVADYQDKIWGEVKDMYKHIQHDKN